MNPNLREARILILDDEVGMACLVSNFLHRLGYQNSRRVDRSAQVFVEMEAFRPDLLLLDLVMPGLNGFQVLDKLRHGSNWERALPVLVLTGETAADQKRRVLGCGASDLLGKPFDPSEFAMRVRNLLDAHFTRQAVAEQSRLFEHRLAERTRQLEISLEELRQSQQRQASLERLQAAGEMACGIVHDFGNTVMSIIGFSEILLRNPSLLQQREVALEHLHTINAAGRDAGQIVDHLRGFCRPREADEVLSPIDLNRLVEETIHRTQPRWGPQVVASGHMFSVVSDLGSIPQISGVAAELREALKNLIFNAVDATSDGSISIRTLREGDQVILEVCDTGVGMTPEVRTHCLEPFFTTKEGGRPGLGLSLVFGVVKRHAGTVEVESVEGCGTTVRLRFPTAVPGLQFNPAPAPATAARACPPQVLTQGGQDSPRATPRPPPAIAKVLAGY